MDMFMLLVLMVFNDALAVDDILDIHKYLMKKQEIL